MKEKLWEKPPFCNTWMLPYLPNPYVDPGDSLDAESAS
jgi:hypothetical protein